MQDIATIETVLGFITGAILFVLAIARLSYFLGTLKAKRAVRKLQNSNDESVFSGPFTRQDFLASLQNYIMPDCSQSDPSDNSDLRYVASVREPVFDSVDRYFDDSATNKYLMILADSGMGKTSFCLNYFTYRNRKSREENYTAIVSLSNPYNLAQLNKIRNKRDTVLIIDALDEDAKAIHDFNERFTEIMLATKDFRGILITCRSQFFERKDMVPTDTGIALFIPRRGGQIGTYRINQLYLVPFNQKQIDKYLRRSFSKFTLFSVFHKRAAKKLVERIPELSVRPMLLELLPDLIRDEQNGKRSL